MESARRLGDFLFEVEEATQTKECLVQGDRLYLTFAGARLALNDFEVWLRPKLSHVQVVAFLANNSADVFFSVIAATSIVPPALLNTRWTPDEIVAALSSGPRIHGSVLILHDEDNTDKALKAASMLRKSSGVSVDVQRLPSIVQRRMTIKKTNANHVGTNCFPTATVAHSTTKAILTSEDAMIVFTSGTTSTPKGVRLSHNAIFCQARVKLRYYNWETRLLATMIPFYHIGGISSILSTWIAGGCIALENTPTVKFEPFLTIASLNRQEINALAIVPAMLYALQEVDSNKMAFQNLKIVLIGGQSASAALLAFTRTAFPNARLIQTFACTEASSSLTFLDVTKEQPSGPVGECVGEPSVDVAVVANDKITSTSWSIGRIATRGPHVMNGYWGHKPQETNSWFISNDLGCWDGQGRLWFCGRTTDTIRTGGETVFCNEVERVLMLHPSIVECSVFGTADERFGEHVCAAVVFHGKPISIQSIKAFCFSHGLTGYKQPKTLFVMNKLPRNSSGKVVKRLLAEQCIASEKRSKTKLTSKL